jgi:hypothetical protein
MLLVDMMATKERDEAALAVRLDTLARNDQLILNALQDGLQRFHRPEELVIAFTKVSLIHIHEMNRHQTLSCLVPS